MKERERKREREQKMCERERQRESARERERRMISRLQLENFLVAADYYITTPYIKRDVYLIADEHKAEKIVSF